MAPVSRCAARVSWGGERPAREAEGVIQRGLGSMGYRSRRIITARCDPMRGAHLLSEWEGPGTGMSVAGG
jgi:hypothetical protein